MELLGGKMLITRDVDFVDLHFFLLVNVDINNELPLLCKVIVLHDVHLSILETFLVKVSFGDDLCLVHHVGSQLIAFHNAHFLHQVIVFRLLHTIDVDLRHAWAHGKGNFQIDLSIHDTVCRNFHRREESLFPISLDCSRDFIARYGNHLANGES